MFREIGAERPVERLRVALLRLLARLQRLRERRMVLGAQQVRQAPVECLLHLVVVEDIAPPRGAHEPVALLDLREALEQRDPLHPEDGAGKQRVELEAATRRDVQQVAVLVGEIADTALYEFQDRRGYLDVAEDLRRVPGAVGTLHQELTVPEPPQELEDEERVAVGLHGDQPGEFLRQPLALQRIAEEVHQLLRPQARQSESRRLRMARDLASPLLVDARPRSTHEQDAVPLYRGRERREQGPPLLRCEVEVLDEQDRRSLRGQGPRAVDEHRLQRVLGQRLSVGGSGIAAQERPECRNEKRCLRQRLAKRVFEGPIAEVFAERG